MTLFRKLTTMHFSFAFTLIVLLITFYAVPIQSYQRGLKVPIKTRHKISSFKTASYRSNMIQLNIATTWDNQTIPDSQQVKLKLSRDGTASAVRLDIEAPFYNDPAPSAPVGSLMQLWDYEVVELFLLGSENRYLEVEFGPFGHYIVLLLDGYRNVIKHSLPLEPVQITRDTSTKRWTSSALIPDEYFPPNVTSLNAYAIHGTGESRQYLALSPVPTGKFEAPEFHRLEYFKPTDLSSVLPVNSGSEWSDTWKAALATTQ